MEARASPPRGELAPNGELSSKPTQAKAHSSLHQLFPLKVAMYPVDILRKADEPDVSPVTVLSLIVAEPVGAG